MKKLKKNTFHNFVYFGMGGSVGHLTCALPYQYWTSLHQTKHRVSHTRTMENPHEKVQVALFARIINNMVRILRRNNTSDANRRKTSTRQCTMSTWRSTTSATTTRIPRFWRKCGWYTPRVLSTTWRLLASDASRCRSGRGLISSSHVLLNSYVVSSACRPKESN